MAGSTTDIENKNPFVRLEAIMRQLRAPEGGCPWDVEQTFETIAPYTIEEAYEVADAIQRNDLDELREELGDLLFQVVFHSQMADEAGAFSFHDVAESICEKMIRRHPHVFVQGDDRTASDQIDAWEVMKAKERKEKSNDRSKSALDGVALALPALLRAEKIQKRAARTGFDWATPEPIIEKIEEEISEVKEVMNSTSTEKVEEEIGDLLFACANLARRLNIDPETALRKANIKFERRFQAMEQIAEQAKVNFESLNLDEQEELWNQVKSGETQEHS